VTAPRDPSLDVLRDLDGQVLVVEGGHRVLRDFWTMVDTVLRERGVIP
jgi:hypothetical protein